MSDWHVHLAKQAEDDLRDLYEHVAFDLLEPGVAKRLIQRIWKRVEKLNNLPQSFAPYPKEPWKSRGLRRVNSGKHAVFFIPDEETKTVIVIRVLYGGRDIEQILVDMLDDSSE